MELQTKALYNLIQFSAAEDPSFACEMWQQEDLRERSTEQLFALLGELGLFLHREKLLLYMAECETPEDLADCLLSEMESDELQDRFYLILFELWRRLAPEKRSLSVFCDELDHLIFLYDHDRLTSDEHLQDALAELIEVLQESVDEGEKVKGLLSRLNRYCSYDIETFLIDYILDQIYADNDSYAAELLEGFYPYLADDRWTDFLRIQLLARSDDVAADEEMQELIERCKKEPSLELQMEMLSFLSGNLDPGLFLQLIKITLPSIQLESELKDLLNMMGDYFRKLDQEKGEALVDECDETRQRIPDEEIISDKDRAQVLSILKSAQ